MKLTCETGLSESGLHILCKSDSLTITRCASRRDRGTEAFSERFEVPHLSKSDKSRSLTVILNGSVPAKHTAEGLTVRILQSPAPHVLEMLTLRILESPVRTRRKTGAGYRQQYDRDLLKTNKSIPPATHVGCTIHTAKAGDHHRRQQPTTEIPQSDEPTTENPQSGGLTGEIPQSNGNTSPSISGDGHEKTVRKYRREMSASSEIPKMRTRAVITPAFRQAPAPDLLELTTNQKD